MIDKPDFFEGTGMPNAGWWEALWPDPAQVLVDVGISAGMQVIYAAAMVGSHFPSQRSQEASSLLISTANYLKPRKCDLRNVAALQISSL
jgi:hypothetical protein